MRIFVQWTQMLNVTSICPIVRTIEQCKNDAHEHNVIKQYKYFGIQANTHTYKDCKNAM